MQEAEEAQINASGPDMFANRYDPETTFEGTFEISKTSVGKRNIPCYIITTDGERMICSYEPLEEYRQVSLNRSLLLIVSFSNPLSKLLKYYFWRVLNLYLHEFKFKAGWQTSNSYWKPLCLVSVCATYFRHSTL